MPCGRAGPGPRGNRGGDRRSGTRTDSYLAALGAVFDQRTPLRQSLRRRHPADFLAALEWWRLEPAHELIRNQPGDVTRRMVLAQTAAGDLSVAYLPDNDAIEVDLSQFRAPLSGRWFDPVRGRYTPLPDRLANQRIHRFTPPAKGDWALLLERR